MVSIRYNKVNDIISRMHLGYQTHLYSKLHYFEYQVSATLSLYIPDFDSDSFLSSLDR